jgi:tetratricopeptide (TPR) repeat protein
VRAALRGLDPRNAVTVSGHLVAAGTLVDDDPEAALAHARAARDRASRVAAVREAVGVAAYHAGDYAEAARELRAYRRMSGDPGYRAVLADCERALGRPEVALRLISAALAEGPDEDEVAELRLVESGARRDLGETAASRLVLEDVLGGRSARPEQLRAADPARLRAALAYAELLRAEGETELADRWAAAVAEADPALLGDPEAFDVVFGEAEDLDEPVPGDLGPAAADSVQPAVELDEESAPEGPQTAAPDRDADDRTADEPAGGAFPVSGGSFDDEVEAEVRELLGETGGPEGQPHSAAESPEERPGG